MQNEKYLSNFDVAQFKWSRYIAVYNIKVVQNNCFLFYFIYNRTVVCSMFNNYSILFKINLSNKIKFVCHCYQTYCIYYFPILHQAQHHCQNFKVTYSAFVCIFTILEVITHCYCVFCLSTCLIIFTTIYIELVSFFLAIIEFVRELLIRNMHNTIQQDTWTTFEVIAPTRSNH